MKVKTKNYILLAIYFLSINFALQSLPKVFAEDTKSDKNDKSSENVQNTEENTENPEVNKKYIQIETTAKGDYSNLNFYPKLNLDSPNLFTGATTLKYNEVFARLGVSALIPTGYLNASGVIEKKEQVFSLNPTVTLAWGILDELYFSANIPYKFYASGTNGISDPWISLKYKFLTDPINLAFQIESKIPLGDSSKTNPFGDGQADIGGMVLATKFFDPIFIQTGIGYKYRFSNATTATTSTTPTTATATVSLTPTVTTGTATATPTTTNASKLTDTLNYVVDIGTSLSPLNFLLPEFDNIMFDFSVYGSVPIGSGTKTGNILSISPNLTYKFSNMDINLSYHQTFLGNNIDKFAGIYGGVTFKELFEYPKVFELILAPKIDKETLDIVSTSLENEKGKNEFIENCSKCHLLVDPKAYKVQDWQTIVDKYKVQKMINKKEYNRIVEYLNDYIETSKIPNNTNNTKELQN